MLFRRGPAQAEQGWNGLYRIGGLALAGVGLLYIAGAILSLVIGTPPGSGREYSDALAAAPSLSTVTFILFSIADFLLFPAGLAFYYALRIINKTAMILALIILGSFVFLDIGITELNSLTIVTLTQNMASAAGEAQRAGYEAALSYALATIPVGTFLGHIVPSVAVLIISAVMLKGPFMRIVGLLGIGAALIGIVGGFYVFSPPLSVLLVPRLFILALWCIAAGMRLNTLGKLVPRVRLETNLQAFAG